MLELLLTTEAHRPLTPEEMRLKHAVAAGLLRWPAALADAGQSTAAALQAYVNAGPFAPQRTRAAVPAAPLTL